MPQWTPDVEIDDTIGAQLLASRFPELSPVSLRLLGSGWDNHAYLVNGTTVFRIPHRKLGAELMETECTFLAYLAQHHLPLPIPNPQFVAAPDERFPYRIAGYPLIEGTTADGVEWTLAERAANAEALGRFLAALHRIPSNVPFAIGDKLKRADLQYRLPIALSDLSDAPKGLREVFEEIGTTPQFDRQPVWVHGDLYSRHLVVDPYRRVCGLIDWGGRPCRRPRPRHLDRVDVSAPGFLGRLQGGLRRC